MTKRTRRTSRKTVGFRLDHAQQRQLDEMAQTLRLGGNAHAKHFVVEALQRSRDAAEEPPVARASQLETLHADLLLVTEALLCSAGKVSEKDARAWIGATFQQPC